MMTLIKGVVTPEDFERCEISYYGLVRVLVLSMPLTHRLAFCQLLVWQDSISTSRPYLSTEGPAVGEWVAKLARVTKRRGYNIRAM